MSGGAHINVRVSAIDTIALGIKRFRLEPVAGGTLPPFSAGSHLVHIAPSCRLGPAKVLPRTLKDGIPDEEVDSSTSGSFIPILLTVAQVDNASLGGASP